MKLSAVMVFYNEENFLDRSLSCVKSFADEIVVFDSFSTDRSLSIAEKYGCKIYQHEFDNHRDQKNRAIEKCSGEWIILIDADEYFEDKLINSIQGLMDNTDGIDAYGFPRKNYLDNSGPLGYPDFQIRLFKNYVRHFGHPFHHGAHDNAKKPVCLLNSGDIIHDKTNERQDKQHRLYYSLRPQDYNFKAPRGSEDVVINEQAIKDPENVNVYKDYLGK